MTNLELLTALGGISAENLFGAEELQSKPCVRANGKMKMKRAVLIAAVIALTLLLVGCAVAAYARIHMKYVQHNVPTEAVQTDEKAPNTTPVRNVLTDCYPQEVPAQYRWLAVNQSAVQPETSAMAMTQGTQSLSVFPPVRPLRSRWLLRGRKSV